LSCQRHESFFLFLFSGNEIKLILSGIFIAEKLGKYSYIDPIVDNRNKKNETENLKKRAVYVTALVKTVLNKRPLS